MSEPEQVALRREVALAVLAKSTDRTPYKQVIFESARIAAWINSGTEFIEPKETIESKLRKVT